MMRVIGTIKSQEPLNPHHQQTYARTINGTRAKSVLRDDSKLAVLRLPKNVSTPYIFYKLYLISIKFNAFFQNR